jgi:ElaB/YqjD/DUF883 family membrane-anchored ribosome-binding protein
MTTDNYGSDMSRFDRPALDDASTNASGVVGKVQDKAKELGREAVSAIDAQREPLANTMASTAESLHEGGEKAAQAGREAGATASRLAHGAADKLQAGAEFIRSHDLNDIVATVERYVRENPGKALLAAGFVGFMAARSLRTD